MEELAPAGDGLVVLSNRGPLSWSRDADGRLSARRGGGGLVSGLAPLVSDSGALWIAAAMSEADRQASREGLTEAEGIRTHLVDLDPATYRMAYDVVANAVLWFLYHGLFDLTRRPRFEQGWRKAWDAYRDYNAAFAEAAVKAAPHGATVLVQDYHLALVPKRLSELRPDLRAVHFSHTPFAEPGSFAVLPDRMAVDVLEGMSAAVACGFHDRRWADRFDACCEAVLGRPARTFVSSLGPDVEDLRKVAASEQAVQAGRALEEQLAGRRLVVRVDRIEPSKNILRGLLAFDRLLETHAELVGRVVMLALAYPSREGLAEYLAYRAELETLASDVNLRWATDSWRPVELELGDDFPRSVAALERYDVLLVNPIRDGLNLVAKEGPALNRTDGVVVLSREAGVWPELRDAVLTINPFDVEATSEQLARALAMGDEERARLAEQGRRLATARSPAHWLADQMAAAAEEAQSS
ncbi:MAG: trehalose-6-phosphate synthase [Actinomycetota bacterium]|nr:trehalose-6-phosphate synthase [Actinomycetota bacterium]